MWPNIIRNRSQIFSHHPRVAGFDEHSSQVFFAFSQIRFAMLGCGIVPRCKVRCAASGFFQHLIPIEWEKFLIPGGTPWECVNAIKAEDVIDSKDVENFADT